MSKISDKMPAMTCITIGWKKFVMPTSLAVQVFSLLSQKDVYEFDTVYDNGVNTPRLWPIDHGTVHLNNINEYDVVLGITLKKQELEAKEAERNAKE